MRLIDADKLETTAVLGVQLQHADSRYYYFYEEETIDKAPTVEAITVEWISDYIHKAFDDESKAQDIIVMCYVWNLEQGRKENETN